MKKVLICLILVAFTLLSVFAGMSFAETSSENPTIYIMEDVYGAPGETVPVRVGFANMNGKSLLYFTAKLVAEGASVVSETDFEGPSLLTPSPVDGGYGYVHDDGTFGYACFGSFPADSTYFTVKVTIPETAKYGDVISLNLTEADHDGVLAYENDVLTEEVVFKGANLCVSNAKPVKVFVGDVVAHPGATKVTVPVYMTGTDKKLASCTDMAFLLAGDAASKLSFNATESKAFSIADGYTSLSLPGGLCNSGFSSSYESAIVPSAAENQIFNLVFDVKTELALGDVVMIAPLALDALTVYGDSAADLGVVAVTNYTAGKLSVCPKISGASLTLQDNIAVSFKVSAAQFGNAFTDPYIEFTFGGTTYDAVRSTVMDANGRYIYNFSNIAPSMMNDKITAKLYATYKGEVVLCQSVDYSVSDYCYNQLKYCMPGQAYANNEAFKTLLVDLLNYGAASQKYVNYKTDHLVNANLSATQKAWGTATVPALSTVQDPYYKTIEDASATWKGAGLLLNDTVELRFKLTTDSLAGLSVHITTDKNQSGWMIDSFTDSGDGGYYVYFRSLIANQMRETVYLTVYRNGVAVSNTLRYSIESYAYSKQNDANLANLLIAMMRYGDAATKYAK